MSLRGRLLGAVEVLMRIPPIFVVDEILKNLRGIQHVYLDDIGNVPDDLYNYTTTDHIVNNVTMAIYNPRFSRLVLMSVMRLVLALLGCSLAMLIFILNTKHLTIVYLYIMSAGVVVASYFTNSCTMRTIIECRLDGNTLPYTEIFANLDNLTFTQLLMDTHNNWAYDLFENILLQFTLATVFTIIHLGPRYDFIQRILIAWFLLPSILAFLPVPDWILKYSPVVSTILPLVLTQIVLWSSFLDIINSMYLSFMKVQTFISNFGITALIETEWLRLNIPDVLRAFWILRTMENTVLYVCSDEWLALEGGPTRYYSLAKYMLVSGCDTLTAIIGLTSVVSLVCNYIGKLFQWILLAEDENDKNFGTVSAIVFYILALQTGLTGLKPSIRFVRLCRNFCLLFTALLHFTHNIVNPLLMNLSASHNPSVNRHARALFVCFSLVFLSLGLMYFLYYTQPISTWLLAVMAFSIEVIVKVIVSLAIYCLFIYDAKRETFWEKLDDYIYYIRSFGNTIEFCFGIFLFFNGAWILLFESGSAIRAIMMCVHAYFNIWCDAKAGWSIFMKRRTAVNKIESLPEADEEQLQQLDDVCAICYQEMLSAKITKCKHFFHGVCLRKWLYVQDRCPLCHEILHLIDNNQDRRRSNNQDAAGGDPAAAPLNAGAADGDPPAELPERVHR